MSLRNQIIKLRNKYPNDQEFGAAVNKLILASRTCCDDKSNHTEVKVENAGPYGYYGTEIRCKCGKMVDFKIDSNE